MRIAHIGTADNSGGAARASYQIHMGLLKEGHESSMVVGQQTEQRQEIDRIGFPRTLIGKVCGRFVQEFETWTGLQYLWQPLKHRFLDHPFVKNADIIHLHNLHGNFFSFSILPKRLVIFFEETCTASASLWACSICLAKFSIRV